MRHALAIVEGALNPERDSPRSIVSDPACCLRLRGGLDFGSERRLIGEFIFLGSFGPRKDKDVPQKSLSATRFHFPSETQT